jgi:hypothetical protein
VYVALALFGLLLASDAVSTPPEPLSFREFFEPSPQALQPTARLLGLQGKPVRLVAYMARMEALPKGGFYLRGSPVLATDAGGGTADLPLAFTSGVQNSMATDGITSPGLGGFNRRGFWLTSRGHHTLNATFTDVTGTVAASSDIEIVDIGGRGGIRNVIIML